MRTQRGPQLNQPRLLQIIHSRSHFLGPHQAHLLPQVILPLETLGHRLVLKERSRAHGPSLPTSRNSMPFHRPPHNFHSLYNPHSSVRQVIPHLLFSPKETIVLRLKSTRAIILLPFNLLFKLNRHKASRTHPLLSTGGQPLPIHGRLAIPHHRTLPWQA